MQTKGLVVTTSWDDGTITDLKLSELLNKYHLSGSFYICKDTSVPNLLSDDDIVAIDKEFEVGAHTINHLDLTQIPLTEVSREIGDSKAFLEDLLGHSISMFAYPYGKYNYRVEQEIISNGLDGARTCEPRVLKVPQKLYRLDITILASDKSPLMALKICTQARLFSIGRLFDWESRANAVFDLAVKIGLFKREIQKLWLRKTKKIQLMLLNTCK